MKKSFNRSLCNHLRYGTLEQRFWSRVNKSDGCWNWIGRTINFGYGIIVDNKTNIYAHRLSWMMHNGAIPDNMCVLHKCDNPKCVNPDHLFLGTIQDNNKDRFNKQRTPQGEIHCHAKLTDDNVRYIKEYPKQRGYINQLAEMFNVTYSNIWLIVNGKSWKHIKGNV